MSLSRLTLQRWVLFAALGLFALFFLALALPATAQSSLFGKCGDDLLEPEKAFQFSARLLDAANDRDGAAPAKLDAGDPAPVLIALAYLPNHARLEAGREG